MTPRRSPRLLVALALLFTLHAPPAPAQKKGKTESPTEKAQAPAVFCDPARAVALVAQQVSESKEMEDEAGRVAVLVRAADLLWPHEQKAARDAFADAFDLASAHFRARGDETRREKGRADSKMSGLSIQLPDQRFVVLRAIAKRDPAWARELSERVAEQTRREAEEGGGQKGDRMSALRGSEKFLALAAELWEVDRDAALQVLRLSFRHPAGYSFQRLLYKIAESDPALAASLYREALGAYADRTVEDLIYISAFPFGFYDIIGPATVTTGGSLPPKGFVPDPALQRLFVEALLRLGERRLVAAEATPAPESGPPRPAAQTERGQLFTALATLEPIVARTLPAYSARVAALKSRAVADIAESELPYLTRLSRRTLLDDGRPPASGGDIEGVLKDAETVKDPDRRDQVLVLGLLSKAADASLDKLLEAAGKISDAATRREFLDYVYFQRGQKSVKEGALEEAARLAEKIEALDDRALLLLSVADEGLKVSDDRARAEQLLDAVLKAADRAPETLAKARALLGVAHLYARFNFVRGEQVLGEAVKVANKLPDPDLVSSVIRRRVQGKTFGFFTSYPVTGFNLENAFRELGERDFEGVLSVARGLDDRRLRGLAALAVTAKCLAEPPTKKEGRER